MRSRASGAARLHASFCCFCERALALSDLWLFPISFSCSYICTLFGRAAPDRAGARPYRSQRHRLIKSSNPGASSPSCSLYDPRSGSNPRLLCLTNLYFGQLWSFDRRATKHPSKILSALLVPSAPSPLLVALSLNTTSAILLVSAFSHPPSQPLY